jgi:uncharacterized protein (TIGR00369 family)
MAGVELSAAEQRRRREWFRAHWQDGVAFNRHCGVTVVSWDTDGTELRLPYSDELSAHDGIFHGGVVAALLDTTATGAVMAGHDFARGSRMTTVSMSVHYFSVAPGEDLRAVGRCLRRGRGVSFAEAFAYGTSSGKLVAGAHLVVNVGGERPGVPWSAPGRPDTTTTTTPAAGNRPDGLLGRLLRRLGPPPPDPRRRFAARLRRTRRRPPRGFPFVP